MPDPHVDWSTWPGVKQSLTIRYSNATGEKITDEQIATVKAMPVDLMDLVSALFDRGITVQVEYPAGCKPHVFPRFDLTVKTPDGEFLDLVLPPIQLAPK
jgi:hypothetical protein